MKLQEEGSNKKPRTSTQNLQQQVTKNTSNDLNKSLNCIKHHNKTAYTLQDKKSPTEMKNLQPEDVQEMTENLPTIIESWKDLKFTKTRI